MTIQELSAVLQSGALQMKEGEAAIIILNTGKQSQTYVRGADKDIKTALTASLLGEKGVCDIVVSTVNQIHDTLRETVHDVITEKGFFTRSIPGMKGGEA